MRSFHSANSSQRLLRRCKHSHLVGAFDGLNRLIQTGARPGNLVQHKACRRLLLAAPLVVLHFSGSRSAAAFEYVEVRSLPDGGTLLDANDFEFSVPPGYVDLGVPPAKRSGMQPGGPGAPPPPSPIKARWGTPDGSAFVTVIVREASTIKPTFTQLTDITQWGSASEVARLVAPRSAQVTAVEKVAIPRPPKDTGTFLGVVEQGPLNVYRYRLSAQGDQTILLAALAQKGKVYVLAAQAITSSDTTRAALQGIVASFRCKDEFKPKY